MRSHQIDAASGSRLVGGEMLQWSDLERGVQVGACAELLGAVLRSAEPLRRVLLLGPKASQVIDSVPRGAEVDVLVRGLPDARTLSMFSQVRPGVTVHCGSVDRFDPELAYDLVVALDEMQTLISPDSAGLPHLDYLHRLAKWVTPEGAVLVSLANELGLDRMFRLMTREVLDDDSMWHRAAASGFDPRALYHRELAGVLQSAGMTAQAVYAAFPGEPAVSLLVDSEVAEHPAVAGVAGAMAARVEGGYFSARPSLVDAHDLTLQVFDSGTVMQLAPSWVVVARSSAAIGTAAQPAGDVRAVPGTAERGTDPAPVRSGGLPALIATEDTGRLEWRAVRTLEPASDGWSQTVRPAVAGQEMWERLVLRDHTLEQTRLPQGTSLEALLRRACAAGDVPGVRSLVQQYAQWLGGSEARGPGRGDARFFMVPANVCVSEQGMTGFDLTWRWTGSLDDDVVLVRGLRDFARRLLRSGAEHPWTPGISPDALTQTLLAMASRPWSPRSVDQVARAEAELETVLNGGDSVQESLRYAANLESGRSQFNSVPGPSRGYREALAASGRMAQALHEREGQVEWLEATLRSRDVLVGELEHTLAAIRGSISFRIGRFFTWPLRAAVGGFRRLVLSLVPYGYIARAKGVLRRLMDRQANT